MEGCEKEMESKSGWRLWIADVALWDFGRGQWCLSPALAGWHQVKSNILSFSVHSLSLYLFLSLSLSCSPFLSPYPGPDSLVPGAWPRRVSPKEPVRRWREGAEQGLRDRLQNHSCGSPASPSSLLELAGTGVVWRPGPPNKAVEFTQRANRGGSLTDKKPGAQIVTLRRERRR
ncbi:unnamed protein product [Leuciscus chuanchicus]